MKYGLIPAFIVLATALAPRSAYAEADARDYEGLSSAPNGTVAVWNYLRHSSTSSGSDVVQNSATYRATYIMRFGNFAFIPFDAAVSVADATLLVPLSETAPQPRASIRQSGFTDLQYFPTLGYNVVEDKESNTHTYGGITAFLTLPTGSYSTSNFFNIGENRWAFKPQIMVGQRFGKIFTAELIGNLQWYGQNSNYMVPTAPQLGKQTLKQDLSYNMELHLAADVHETMFVGASLYISSTGAETFALGTPAGTMTQTVEDHGVVETLRFTWGIHIEKQTLALLQLNQDLHASGGLSNSRFIGVRLSHYFW